MASTFQQNIDKLAKNLPKYLKKTREIPGGVFSGPSVYFHQRAIEEAKGSGFLKLKHLQMIYAMLPAWGMHRMGENKVKVKTFVDFQHEIETIAENLKNLKNLRCITEVENIDDIIDLMFKIKINIPEAKSLLVSSSKTLHHMLPDIIPPIDRAYSVRFMIQDSENFDTKTVSLGSLKREKELAKEFMVGMKIFIENYGNKMKDYLDEQFNTDKEFNTSLPKIFDNLIVAFIRDKRGMVKNETD